MTESMENHGAPNSANLLFNSLKFFVTGQVPEKVINQLKNGGAERMNYFSDYVTHLICGEQPEETDLTDANDLYEVPAVTTKWVEMCLKLNKLVSTRSFLYSAHKLFRNLVFCPSKLGVDLENVWAMITYHGGKLQLNLDRNCTHLIAYHTKTPKYNKAITSANLITIITPDWVIESIRKKKLIPSAHFHPRLVEWPKVIKHESTVSITGFEPEKLGTDDGDEDKTHVNESTQALLEQLKQRMPWNRPEASSSTDVAPPNVVAPTFKMQQQLPRQPFNLQQQQFLQQQQQIPRSIVHHAPQQQIMSQQQSQLNQQQPQPQQNPQQVQLNPQQQQPQQLNQQQHNFNVPNQLQLNRMVGQQPRPNLQQLRGQLTQAQMQQLMQQRLQQQQQQQQQNNQRPLNQQQILQQRQMAGVQLQQMQQLLNQPGQTQQQFTQQQLLQQQQQSQNNQVLQQQSMLHQHKQQMLQQPGQILQQPSNQLVQQQPQQNQLLQQPQQNQLLQQPQQNQLLQQPQQNQLLQQPQQNQLLQQPQQNQLLQQQQQQKMFPPPPPPPLQQAGQQLMQQQQQQQFVVATPQQPQFPQQQVQQQSPQIQQQFPQQPPIPNQQFAQQQPQPQFQQQVLQPNQFVNQQQQRPHLQQQMWQQQQQQQPQINANRPLNPNLNLIQQQQQPPGQRLQWSPNQQQQQPQRQYIQLDAQTHNQLQKMPPEQQALFVARLQKQKQLLMQQKQMQQQQQQQRHILIRGSVPPGLNPQQQMQWLQQQAKQQGVVLPPNIQQQTIVAGQQQTLIAGQQQATLLATGQQSLTIGQQQQQQQSLPIGQPQPQPGLSPISGQPQPQQQPQQQQQQPFVAAETQLQMRQFRLQQLQQAQKQQQLAAAAAAAMATGQQAQTNNIPTPDAAASNVLAGIDQQPQQPTHLVNTKAKTALANMLSNRLQTGGTLATTGGTEPPTPPLLEAQSAAGTLRLMTAQHNASLNNNRTPQDLLALQRNRNIKTDLLRPQQPLQFTPRPPQPPMPLQHRPGPFYGHNPNLKLPPDLFLLGCIFVVVEIEMEIVMPGWLEKIEKHGGEVEKQYCNRVTHVLCQTQRHGVVMQALRDCKRCVTIYWLQDVMERKQVLPPWTALHLPTAYLDTTPAAKHLIALSGFSGMERQRVKAMILNCGAKFTKYFSKHNTILVAAKSEGMKFVHAKKWGTPVVNIQWLTDLLLGNFTALNQIEHVGYQQFPPQNGFSFDPKFIPNLMHAWKMPINISQESYERVKRSASPVLMPKKLKKPKLEAITDENDNFNSNEDGSNANYRILFSHSTDVDSLEKVVKHLGGVLAKSHLDCTHLVMKALSRTNKLLLCLCRGDVRIISEQWLRDSKCAEKFLEETDYSLETKEFNSEYKCNFTQTLATNNRNKLMEGKTFWVTPNVFPNRKLITELIESCGGVVERIRRTAQQIEHTNLSAPYSYIIITHESDIHLVADLLRNKKEKIRIVCNAELIFSAVLRQTFQVEPYAVKVV